MGDNYFYHALEINEALCTGCSHCVSVCPTEAIRLKNGKSVLVDNHCVDCGECIRVCPSEAIQVNQDDFKEIFNFKHRVALVPAVLLGQFPEFIDPKEVYAAILSLGFTHIYEVENAVALLEDELPNYQKKNRGVKPLISAFCPAIVRLIQVRYPSLVSHLVLQRPPLDLAALFVQKELCDKGADLENIGIFYITPCAAKIVAIKDPVGEQSSPISGAINMDVFINKIIGLIERNEPDKDLNVNLNTLNDKSVRFSLTRGEQAIAMGRSLAVDGMQNVIDFLEKVENEEIDDLDFLELRACDEGCADGVLTSRNKFLAVEYMKKNPFRLVDEVQKNSFFGDIEQQKDYLLEHIHLEELQARSMIKLDDDIGLALKKMETINELLKVLPNVDCTLCGAPNCKALAQDIAEGKASLEHCIFIQKKMEERGELSQIKSAKLFKDIWGKEYKK